MLHKLVLWFHIHLGERWSIHWSGSYDTGTTLFTMVPLFKITWGLGRVGLIQHKWKYQIKHWVHGQGRKNINTPNTVVSGVNREGLRDLCLALRSYLSYWSEQNRMRQFLNFSGDDRQVELQNTNSPIYVTPPSRKLPPHTLRVSYFKLNKCVSSHI